MNSQYKNVKYASCFPRRISNPLILSPAKGMWTYELFTTRY